MISSGHRRPYQTPNKYPHRNPWQRLIHYVKSRPDKKRAQEKIENPSDRAVRSTARATWVMASFTLVLAVITGLTLIEIYRGGADTSAIACAAQKSAQAASDFATAAKNMNIGIGDAVRKLDTQAGQTRRLANQSADQAKTARLTLEGDRAWLSLASSDITKFEIGQKIGTSIFIVNSGDTPALNVSGGIMETQHWGPPPVGQELQEFVKRQLQKVELRPLAVVPPRQPTEIEGEAEKPEFALTPELLGDLQTGRATDYLFVRVEYFDVSGRPQWLTVASRLGFDKGAPRWQFLPFGNDMSYQRSDQEKAN